jgi:hypothetical protein
MAKGLDWQSQKTKKKVSKPKESTHNLEILVMDVLTWLQFFV